ncbi:hypothetical protein V2W30_00185 [Streptomyces sp. Q6]|uniref:Uncharacterized protein n=1 Tax=Streptomyces citrinus TaxID=3118173 RepID=A0ACD5A472_9ACTN
MLPEITTGAGMDWVAWAASGAGVLFIAAAIYGYATRPDAPRDAAIKHTTFRIRLPLLMAWFFLWRELPNALQAPWAVDATGDVIGLAAVVIVALAVRRRRRATPDGDTGPAR